MKPRPRLLFLSPIVPQLTGNGLAMRAGALLEALSRTHDVYLLVIPVSGRPGDRLPDRLEEACLAVESVPLSPSLFHRLCHHPVTSVFFGRLHPYPAEWKYVNDAALAAAQAAFEGIEFDRVHVFRMYLHPFAAPRLASFDGQAHLDLDDIESTTRSALSTRAPNRTVAGKLMRDARHYRKLEAEILPEYDAVYACSSGDRERLKKQYALEQVRVVPNTVRISGPLRTRSTHDPFTFLFLGNLDYAPNRDALDWLTSEVLPAMRSTIDEPFKVIVAGSGRKMKNAWSKAPGFDVRGFVPDVENVYRESDALIAPLRAGGGTRIKLLESLAHGLPVVSTSTGAAGLDLAHREHLLIADTPRAFAESCREIMRDEALRHELSRKAFEKVTTAYSQETLETLLREVPDGK